MAPWLAITSATPRLVLPAALGSSHHSQMRTVPSTVLACGQRQPSPQHSGHPVLGAVLKQGVPPTVSFHCPLSAWPFWACTEGLGWSNGASTVWDGISSKLIEVNSRLMLVGFMLWPPKERQLQFLVFLVFPGLNQHKSLPQRPRGKGSPRR